MTEEGGALAGSDDTGALAGPDDRGALAPDKHTVLRQGTPAIRSGPGDTSPTAPAAPTVLTGPTCQRCGFPVPKRLQGCKNPCPNCHTIYPLGDCSD